MTLNQLDKEITITVLGGHGNIETVFNISLKPTSGIGSVYPWLCRDEAEVVEKVNSRINDPKQKYTLESLKTTIERRLKESI
jgi:hypothetical protein